MRSFFCCIAAIGVLCSVAVPLHAQCSNSLLTGTYFYLISGSLVSGNTALPYAELGVLVADGQGHATGQSRASINGTLGTYSLSAAYTVQANCRGNMTLTVNSSVTEPFDFEVVNGGQSVLLTFSSPTGVIVGRAYQAPQTCGNGSLSGSYGFLLSGVSGGVFSEE